MTNSLDQQQQQDNEPRPPYFVGTLTTFRGRIHPSAWSTPIASSTGSDMGDMSTDLDNGDVTQTEQDNAFSFPEVKTEPNDTCAQLLVADCTLVAESLA